MRKMRLSCRFVSSNGSLPGSGSMLAPNRPARTRKATDCRHRTERSRSKSECTGSRTPFATAFGRLKRLRMSTEMEDTHHWSKVRYSIKTLHRRSALVQFRPINACCIEGPLSNAYLSTTNCLSTSGWGREQTVATGSSRPKRDSCQFPINDCLKNINGRCTIRRTTDATGPSAPLSEV